MADWWTKRSSLPSSGEMKPNPLVTLNHFTVPFTLSPILRRRWKRRTKTLAGNPRSVWWLR
uniref:Uncharacterized protein n=1 Tax=Triticum urartu TaxID=4572 RepID=A0A8R7P5H5_TRIUA